MLIILILFSKKVFKKASGYNNRDTSTEFHTYFNWEKDMGSNLNAI